LRSIPGFKNGLTEKNINIMPIYADINILAYRLPKGFWNPVTVVRVYYDAITLLASPHARTVFSGYPKCGR
jgi:hypothetical protein